MKLINFLNKEKVDKLSSMGFLYIEKTIDDKTVYSFFENSELMEILNGQFSKNDFFVTNTVNFNCGGGGD